MPGNEDFESGIWHYINVYRPASRVWPIAATGGPWHGRMRAHRKLGTEFAVIAWKAAVALKNGPESTIFAKCALD